MSTWLRTNQGVGACMSVFAVALGVHILASDWAFDRLRDGFYLGSFTLMANFAILLCALSIMVGGRRTVVEEDMASTVWRDWVIALGILATCLVYYHLAWSIDFLIVTAFFMAAATYLLGVRPAKTALIIGVVITIVVYILFRLIGIRLPAELLGL
jgi:hypothetical protein